MPDKPNVSLLANSISLSSWRIVLFALFSLVVLAGCARGTKSNQTSSPSRQLMTPVEFQALPSKPTDHRISYGKDPNQYGELRIPASAGPHPVVILIHGGCWRAEFATLRDLAPMGDQLEADGIASWNIEYRRLYQPGSGWPGTYLDVGQAVDFLRTLVQQYNLDLNRVVVLGHSAGGHLAMWVAARHKLPKESRIYLENPLPIRGVIDLAGTPDMAGYVHLDDKNNCGADVIKGMLGENPEDARERDKQVSALKLLPLGIPQVLIWGRQDDYLTVKVAEKYEQAAKQAGDQIRVITMENTGHFEIATTLPPTWEVVRQNIKSLLGR